LTATVYGTPDEFNIILTKNGKIIENIVTDDREEALQIATELVKKRR
jgi:hypothetical protein